MNLPSVALQAQLSQLLEEGKISKFWAYERKFYYKAPACRLTALQKELNRAVVGIPEESWTRAQVENFLIARKIEYFIEEVPQRVTILDAGPTPEFLGWTVYNHPVFSEATRDLIRFWRANEGAMIDIRARFLPRTGECRNLSIRFLGSGKQVGRSCNLFEIGDECVLIDCGLGFYGHQKPYFCKLDLSRLTGIYITHAHYDHCGATPLLYARGYQGPTYCTRATLVRARKIWMDYLRLAAEAALYTQKDVETCLLHVVILQEGPISPYHHDGTQVRIYRAGHMPGSIMVGFHIKIAGKRPYSVLFTGDYGEHHTLYEQAWPKVRYNTVVSQGTYGASRYKNTLDRELDLVVQRANQAKGKVLVATLDYRASAVFYHLRKKFPKMVFWISAGVRESLHQDLEDLNWFSEAIRENLAKMIAAEEDLPRLNSHFDLALVTPGMLEGGISLEKLIDLAPESENTIVLTSFLAKGTVGRQLVDGSGWVRLVMTKSGVNLIPCRARVISVNGFSGHASGETIHAFLRELKADLILLQHGEESTLKGLARLLQSSGLKVKVLSNLDALRLA